MRSSVSALPAEIDVMREDPMVFWDEIRYAVRLLPQEGRDASRADNLPLNLETRHGQDSVLSDLI